MNNRDIVQDVVPSQKKSIRDIPIPKNQKQFNGTSTPPPSIPTPPRAGEGTTPPVPPTPPQQPEKPRGIPPRRRGKKKFYLLGLGIALLAVVFVAVLSFFDTAEITITPRQENIAVNQTFTATRSGDAAGVPYQTIRVEGENGAVVPATEGEFVETKASGTIRVENTYSEESQRLIANTRFEAEDGKIYRIQDAITVPGMNGTTPGTIDVTVYADEAGPEYNKSSASFTIPGLEGDPRFDGFKATTVSTLSGGFSGTAKKVDEDVKTDAQERIQTELRDELIAEAEATVPGNFVFLPGASTFTFEEMPQSNVTTDSVQINERLILEGVIFEEDVLTDAILGLVFSDARGKASITNLSELSFEVPENIEEEFTFTVSGNANIVWDIDEGKLQDDLAGTKRKNINTVLVNYPAIERAEAVLRPFWKRSFPRDGNEINVRIER